MLAIVFGSPDILSLILNSGADKGDIIIPGRTLFDIAVMLGHKKCATVLKENKIMESTHTIFESSLFVFMDIIELFPYYLSHEHLYTKARYRKEVITPINLDHPAIFSLAAPLTRVIFAAMDDTEVKGPSGRTSLLYAITSDKFHPCAILDLLYHNPAITYTESDFKISGVTYDQFDRSQVRNLSLLAIAIERDLANYEAIRKFAIYYICFGTYEGSLTVLLLDCGYAVRNDKHVLSSYSTLLCNGGKPYCDEMIRKVIKHRIEHELFHPKQLPVSCRDVLRRHFIGHALHRLVSIMAIPLRNRSIY